jgi:hypothetical protein
MNRCPSVDADLDLVFQFVENGGDPRVGGQLRNFSRPSIGVKNENAFRCVEPAQHDRARRGKTIDAVRHQHGRVKGMAPISHAPTDPVERLALNSSEVVIVFWLHGNLCVRSGCHTDDAHQSHAFSVR